MCFVSQRVSACACLCVRVQTLEREMDSLTSAMPAGSGNFASLLGSAYATFPASIFGNAGYTADAHRAEAYTAAQEVNTMLTQLGDTLKDLIRSVNQQYEKDQDDPVRRGQLPLCWPLDDVVHVRWCVKRSICSMPA